MDIITAITREIKHLNSDKIGNSLAIRTLKSAKADLLNIEAQNRPIRASGPMVGWAFLSPEEKQLQCDTFNERFRTLTPEQRVNAEMDRDNAIDGVLHRKL